MTASNVVLHGATGTQGTAILQGLRAAGHHIRAVARSPRPSTDPGVQPVTADLLDLDALTAAYTGADAVVIQLPLTFTADAERQADTVLAALTKAGVPRAIFNTGGGIPPADPIGVPFVDARIRLAACLPHTVATTTVIGPASTYLENLAAPWSRALVQEHGELRYPLPADLPNAWLAAADLGAAIAALVTDQAPPSARLVAGPTPLTGDELAAQIEAAISRPVRWHTVDPTDYARMLSPHLGATVAEGIAGAYRTPAPPPDPTHLTHGETTARAWAGQAFS